ncbi:secreted protein [Candidatus Omnitrophus magneticus]|uniref:Secreted protein n=1 Tax=Candidatus Omnitrophus magneticus TaxID=1609969 RepID=A0A0F0CTG1_9BACT|nr:secreted protein [Candidatus Omnitrophus magneticus]
MKKIFIMTAMLMLVILFSGVSFATETTKEDPIPLPVGQSIFTYMAMSEAMLGFTPSDAMPIGIGDVANGGSTLSISLMLGNYAGNVDIFFGVYSPAIDPNEVYVLHSDGSLQPLSAGLAHWNSTHTTGNISQKLFSDIDISSLGAGVYTLYLAITPHSHGAQTLDNSYIYETQFTVPSSPK